MQNSKCSAIILSAGFSSRMKQAKFSLMYDEKRTFLEKIVEEYLIFGCNEIIVVMNYEGIKLKNKLNLSFPKNVKFVLNKYPERERFYSLQVGFKALQETEFIFMQNIDNPFVTSVLLFNIYKNKNVADYIIPSHNNKGGHPILLSEKIANSIIQEEDYNVILKSHLQNFAKHYVKIEDENILLNINTMEIYNNAINLKK